MRVVVLSLALHVALVAACAGDEGGRKDELPAALRFEPPADCEGELFERTFAVCPTVEMSFPKIWDALDTLSRDRARRFIDDHRDALDACCGSPALIELDAVVGCDGRVVDAAVRGPLFVAGCVEDVVRGWRFPQPAGTERGFHLLLACGPGARSGT